MINPHDFFSSRGLDLFSLQELTGGDINQVYRSNNSVYKINDVANYPEMLSLEADGLEALRMAVKTPAVLDQGIYQSLQFLELEWISEGSKSQSFWLNFGHNLAKLHQQKNELFGYDKGNYIGSLRQSNDYKNSWVEFLVTQRLQPMIEMAVNSGEVNYIEARPIENFYKKISEIYPNEQASLLHGDLWAGNFLCNDSDEVVLIDPAVYYGHREMDIAMMHLFGGFDRQLFDAYNELYPLEPKWASRLEISQIYPLLVHVNLFGRSYWSKVKQTLDQFA